MCPRNFKLFHTFFAEKRRVECKKITCLATKACGFCLERPVLEKHGSPRNKSTRRFHNLISHEFSLCRRIERLWKKDFEKNSKRLGEEYRDAMYSLVSVGFMHNVTTITCTAVA